MNGFKERLIFCLFIFTPLGDTRRARTRETLINRLIW